MIRIDSIRLEGVSKKFRTNEQTLDVLSGVSVLFSKQHSVALSGPSGSGKSTLLHILSGLDTPSQGTVVYITDKKEELYFHTLSSALKQYVQSHCFIIVFQKALFIKELTVLEHCMLKGLIAGHSWDQAKKRAVELLAMVELEDKTNAWMYQLSGGQQQRVAIAQMFYFPPDFIIADEPTSHLDRQTADKVANALFFLARMHKAGVVMATHDEKIAAMADVQYHIDKGTLII